MSPLRTHTLLARSQATRRLLGVVVALLAATTFSHHSGLAPMDMADMHGPHGGDHAAAAALCFAILAGGATIEGLVLVRRLTRRRRRTTRRAPSRSVPPVSSVRPGRWAAPARAGPSLQLRLCVDRR